MKPGRPWRVNPQYLARQIERLKAEGLSLKVIAHRVGYSYSRIRALASNNFVLKYSAGVDEQVPTP